METYRRESRDFFISIRVKVLLCIVDGHSAVDTCRQGIVLHDLDALVATVGVLEEEDCGPVVAEVLAEHTRGACSLVSNVTCHVGTEGVATNNLNVLALERGRDGEDGPGADALKGCCQAQRPGRGAGW